MLVFSKDRLSKTINVKYLGASAHTVCQLTTQIPRKQKNLSTERPTTDELEEFISEISMMKTVARHPNVVALLGCCTIKLPLLMIMEFVGCGDLVCARASSSEYCLHENAIILLHTMCVARCRGRNHYIVHSTNGCQSRTILNTIRAALPLLDSMLTHIPTNLYTNLYHSSSTNQLIIDRSLSIRTNLKQTVKTLSLAKILKIIVYYYSYEFCEFSKNNVFQSLSLSCTVCNHICWFLLRRRITSAVMFLENRVMGFVVTFMLRWFNSWCYISERSRFTHMIYVC